MSQLVTKLNRDGIPWPTPAGTWQQSENIDRLETFANNLDVSQASKDTDLLNSIPTPWARVLLFESALYKPKHPSHRDVEDQWRGLLGVIALEKPLNLKLTTTTVSLNKFPGSRIAKSFTDLRPNYMRGGTDEEADKWNDFQLVSIDGLILGATSPRTFLFTGVSHKCPPSIPFRSSSGRLSDPVAYYRKFGDTFYLQLLAAWIEGLIAALQQDLSIREWMGNTPAAPGASPRERLSSLLEQLSVWRSEFSFIQPMNILGDRDSRFTLHPYTMLKGLPAVKASGESDLFLRGRTDVIVCYNAEGGSKIVNVHKEPLLNEKLHVYDGRWVLANQPLPLPFTFLPDHIQVLEDPLSFFENALIPVYLPDQTEYVHYLKVGSEDVNRRYLFPFKASILEYFTPAELVQNTTISTEPQTRSLVVRLNMPLKNGYSILASRKYSIETQVVAQYPTAELVAWPDFTCAAWNRYFYFKSATADRQVDFEPIIPGIKRGDANHMWYFSTEPSTAFIGSIDGKEGLLLLCDKSIHPPDKYWKIGVDFGSTHTRAFSLSVQVQDNGYKTSQGASIQPVIFSTHAVPLTMCDPRSTLNQFFALKATVSPSERSELKTLLMMPEANSGKVDDWLPREGYAYLYWLYGGDYDADRLRHSLKWNSNKTDMDLRAFLRCLLVMIQAEATKNRARLVSVMHSYPSVFTEALKAKHKAEWVDLGQYLNAVVNDEVHRVRIEDASLNETVAVCRHLEWEQGASPISNTISIDVGGSTSDMAVWANKKLELQESVKMAAGIVGRYLQSPNAKEFLQWLESTLKGAPYNLRDFSLVKFESKPLGYSLMFNNILSALEWQGHLGMLIDQINGAKESRKLLAHIIYLYGALLYYAGLLARKGGLIHKHENYYVYFCGKGGTLIKWIRGFQGLSQDMFEAGLFGPSGSAGKTSPKVIAKMSTKPKEEVGRGLLAESELQGNPKDEGFGLLDPNPPSVTVGEDGYQGLNWDGTLTPVALKALPENSVPKISELTELSAFINAFKRGKATQAAASELGLDGVETSAFENKLLQRLFGGSRGCIVTDIKNSVEDALIEPLFITEVKVLLETATGTPDLFN